MTFSSGSSTSSRLSAHNSKAASLHEDSTQEVQEALEADFDGAVYEGLPVASFAEVVWGLDVGKIDTIAEAGLTLREDSHQEYQHILSTKGKYGPLLRQPFREMARALLQEICRLFTKDNPKLLTYFWDEKGAVALSSKVDTPQSVNFGRKPGLLEVYTTFLDDGKFLDPDASLQSMDSPTAGNIRPVARGISQENMPVLPPEASSAPNSKRAREADSSDTSRPTKRGRRGMTADALQLATYALGSVYEGNRHYTAGFLVDGVNLTLWYYDRSVAISCAPFDFTTRGGIANLGIALFALSQCSMKQAVFDPYLCRFIHSSPDQPVKESSVTAHERPEVETTKLCDEFSTTALKKEQLFIPGKVLIRYRRITGRGTLVAVARMSAVGKMLSERSPNVLELGWQFNTRSYEGDIISRLRTVIPAWNGHLPDPVFCSTLSVTDLPESRSRDILRVKGCTDVMLETEHRSLHVLATHRFKNLWHAESVAEFKRIFLGCLECHYHAWNTGKVLHRDISENNLMIYQPGVTDRGMFPEVQKAAPSRGIVTDFEMASELGPDGKIWLDAHQYPRITGTLPFMALDLVIHLKRAQNASPISPKKTPKGRFANEATSPKYHLYRYDLESFFYILIWAATHYNLEKGKLVKPLAVSGLQFWGHVDANQVHSAKIDIFDEDGLDVLEMSVLEQWDSLWAEWVIPLHRMFYRGFNMYKAHRFETDSLDKETCGGLITFEKFMEAIGEDPRGLTPVQA
ncbi:hypothetical protein HYPSUDRAFT_216680 [Hypholoma sublateritium FD-334 SS-4]|uniref:Fungal-type protein kinase domain-containing protein n=1 Tax=Hypholoma sublateritium (strain FD-334 SS-4) TaxID=945553 RepID=A0A0D2MC56_HYPSF|nr:hypothetical protein HYPSUDRAFT_216680 [Hypholoma sublateritium FD-334 SS-4]